jgi:putative membrane-bound dehydrogenase-like protein
MLSPAALIPFSWQNAAMLDARSGRSGLELRHVAIAIVSALIGAATTQAAGPVDPSHAPQTLKLGDGLEATLFASEPMLSSPSNIDVDASGRVWVCEVVNYRRKKETRKEGDRILVLEDTDGDGKADKQTVFYQGRDVDSALGICVVGEGAGRKVIVSCSPNVLVFHDDDGDLVFDRKEPLFTKTGNPQHDHSLHAFVVGPDGRWYFNFGNNGKAVHDAEGVPVVDRFGNQVNDSGKPYRQGMVFRCRADAGDFETLGWNFRNNFEVAVDAFGTLWQSDNDDDGNQGVRINQVMEYGNYGYVDEKTGAGWKTPRPNMEKETPLRHWHQNDPGVVPNLLQTGGGSPTGICVYEGSLLPERYHGAVIHCDAGPNVVRAYVVSPKGAGYEARIEPIADGSADQWFRPSDVCVAPDGSLIVADWYDPGVGGHGMADTEKGRLYRVAPAGSRWSVPPVDLSTIAGAVAALASPNNCTRATALERIAREPEQTADPLAKAFASAMDQRLKARLAWAAGMLGGTADAWVARLAGDSNDRLRSVAIRLSRARKADVVSLVEKLVADPSPFVRREAAIALRGEKGDRADRAWAELAARHTAGDRWELEALGIGADGPGTVSQWDGRLAAWLSKRAGQPMTAADREIIWRSRASASPALLVGIIADPATSTAESLAFVRSLHFQDRARVGEALPPIVKRLAGPEEKMKVVLPELVMRLDPAAAIDPDVAQRVDELAAMLGQSVPFVQLVVRFGLKNRGEQLIALAAEPSATDDLGVKAARASLDLVGIAPVRATAAAGGEKGARMLTVLGILGDGRAMGIIDGVIRDEAASLETRLAAVRAKARTESGAKQLVALAKAGELAGSLAQVAGHAISACPWEGPREAAADVLPMPKSKGGEKLPPVAELVRRGGKADRGKAVFAGAGTCAKCHVVNGEGKEVGPNLSGVGAKLSREAIYEAILAPSAAISHNYESWTALLDDGRTISGLLISKTPDQFVLRGVDGLDVTLAAAEVEELARQPVSLMPADLAATLSAAELVDLVAWLETLKTPK